MRVVFDTVVLVSGSISPFGSWGRLLFDRAGDYQLVVSPPVVAEYLEVIRRSELTHKYRSVATRDPHSVLDWFARAEVVELADIPAVSRDPKDDPFLATATTGAVDYLVSEDRDLLDLDVHESVPIVTGAAFLAILDNMEASVVDH